jgi:pimeloyl-ACP methyl ester carboxylesterase
MTTLLSAPEQSRARYPDEEGYVERDGVRVFWERYGEGEPTILLPPTWEIVHSRSWKCQIPYLARHARVVTFDPRGNGRSDRPDGYDAYVRREFADDALAVLDAAGVDRAVVISWCDLGESLILAAEHPERVAGLVFIAPPVSLAERRQGEYPFDADPGTDEGWAKETRGYWERDWPGYLEFFFAKCLTEPHSTKQIEDCVGWAGDTDMETILAGFRGWDSKIIDPAEAKALCQRIHCPVLVINGTDDQQDDPALGAALAAELGGRLVQLEGAGHAPHARDPVKVNELVAEFAGVGGNGSAGAAGAGGVGGAGEAVVTAPATRTWTRALRRPKRALYLSSPIGLGHARRDLAIARELRRQVPGLEVDWLAQDPVTRVLEAEGERIHPASAWLANESAHIERESAEHDLHAFQAIRRMDEILIANFMVFHDVVREQPYDLWVGDEAWELDYYLHENPEEKRAAYVWLTDFVGWLPMPDGGEREAFLTADYNAEMIEHIDRFPRLRDRAVFVGNPADIVPDRFGPGLPGIREWVEGHYDFSGYVTGFDPAGIDDRDELRRRLGYRPDERVCIVTVGGSGVGGHLLRRVIAAYPEARRLVPGLRMVVVAGPRIDPASLPSHDGLEVRPYVHNLYQHLAASDLAVVQGGLTTCMELAAAGRPFLYFPLAHHFEQNYHVAHRLRQYNAGRQMDFATATPEVIATAVADEIGRQVAYRPVETDGATRAASLIAQLL